MAGEIKLSIVPTGYLGVNTYILSRGQGAVVVDPGDDAEKIKAAYAPEALSTILLTHAHFDHIGAIDALLDDAPGARFFCHPLAAGRVRDAEANLSALVGAAIQVRHPGETLEGGAETAIAGLTIQTFFVPGHTPDHLCFYLPERGWLFTGDTVFAGGIGRSDFPGGDGALLVSGIRAMLAAVPPATVLFPGHGESSTAGGELAHNPYL